MFVSHSKKVVRLGRRAGWYGGARYTNLRDVRTIRSLGMLDIDWKRYDFARHLDVAAQTRPVLTVARDVEDISQLDLILKQADKLNRYARHVIVVPKDPRLAGVLDEAIPPRFLLGYSVPTKYGGTALPPSAFKRPVHLLGGRPDVQRRLASQLPVVSADGNRFTLDASFGDYFDGERFRPHPVGGYDNCLIDSIRNINRLWRGYDPWEVLRESRARSS